MGRYRGKGVRGCDKEWGVRVAVGQRKEGVMGVITQIHRSSTMEIKEYNVLIHKPCNY